MLLVSVIIPVYNKERYLVACVNSVLQQDLSSEKYEIILVDDGSPDKCPQICDDLATQHQNIQVLHQTNQGVAMARNNGMAIARGEYAAFLDADDWWAPNFLTKMLAFACQYPDAGLWTCNYWYVKTGKTHIGVTKISWSQSDANGNDGYINYPRTYSMNRGMPICIGSMMMRKKVFEEMKGFPQGIRLGEDFLLWSKIALNHKIAFLSEPLAYYNNNIPPSLRATRNLHNPQHHMLFNMQHLAQAEWQNADWKRLCDDLRIGGLLSYWMDKRYHTQAAEELKKVDWTQQSIKVKIRYKMPRWYHFARQNVYHCLSVIKQTLLTNND